MAASQPETHWPHDLSCYIDVLRAARTPVCHSWSRSDATTALNWARHVRAAHHSRPLTSSMRTASRAMGLPRPPTFEEDGTNGALESFRNEIFANNGVPDLVRKVVEESYWVDRNELEKANPDLNGRERLRKDLRRANRPLKMFKEIERVGNTLLQNLEESITSQNGSKDNAALSKQHLELSYRWKSRTNIHIAAANLIYETALDRYQAFGNSLANDANAGTKSPPWLRTFLEEVKLFLMENPEGMETLIHLLLILSSSSDDGPPMIQTPSEPLPAYFSFHLPQLFFSLLLGESSSPLPSSNAFTASLQTMDPWLLARFANSNPTFGKFYISELETWTTTSRIRLRKLEEDMPPKSKKNKTDHKNATILSFKVLEKNWTALVYQDNRELSGLVWSALKCLSGRSDSNFGKLTGEEDSEEEEWKGFLERLHNVAV